MKKLFAAMMLLIMGWGTLQSGAASAEDLAHMPAPAGISASLLMADLFPSGMQRVSQSLRPHRGAGLPKIASAIARVKAGAGRGVIAFVGDSVTAGWGGYVATGTNLQTGANPGANASHPNSWPHQLAGLLTSAGVPARSDAFFPGVQSGEAISDIATANPNMTFGTGWTGATKTPTMGGDFLYFTGSTAGAITFTPDYSANSFDLIVSGASSLGTLTVSDSSGTLATIDETVVAQASHIVTAGTGTSTTAIRIVTVTRAVASTSPITITPTAGKSAYIGAIIPYDTTAPRLELLNMGFPGSKASDWNGVTNATAGINSANPWDPYNALQLLNGYVDGATLELGANDANGSVPVATYQANLQSIANRLAGYGDVQLIKAHQALPTTSAINVPASYLVANDIVAASVSMAPATDFNALSASFVTADYYDGIHLSQQGYGKEAQSAFNALRLATGGAF